MTILGKVLIFLNLLAAGAFTYLTLQDWKLRQELQWARFKGEIILNGLPVEAGEKPTDLDSDQVAFNYTTSGGAEYKSLPKARLADICPPGGNLGGEPKTNQTAEVERLKTVVMKEGAQPGEPGLPAAELNNGVDRRLKILNYLLNLARTGAERDGVIALNDLFDPSKRDKARRDLPFLARTASQMEALRTMIDVVDLGDPQAIADEPSRASAVKIARDAVARFALGEVAHGGGDTAELERQMKNLVAPGDGGKDTNAVKAAAKAPGFEHVADVAANPLNTKANVDAAVASLSAYAVSKARLASEKKALPALEALIKHPIGQNAVPFTPAEVEAASLPLLEERFEDAVAPVAKDGADSFGGKARKIAHLLYHIDANRHLSTTPADVEDRKAWHTRVAWVVGLPTYVQVAEAQASEYDDAGRRLAALITEEETAFIGQYDAAVNRARVLFSRWETLNAEHEAQKAITKENVTLKDERLTERDKLKKELAEAETRAKDALVRLKDTQDRLYTIQKQLRDAQEAILALEKELRRRELGVE